MVMKLELSDQQEQALKEGLPAEVADLASSRAFVLLACE